MHSEQLPDSSEGISLSCCLSFGRRFATAPSRFGVAKNRKHSIRIAMRSGRDLSMVMLGFQVYIYFF